MSKKPGYKYNAKDYKEKYMLISKLLGPKNMNEARNRFGMLEFDTSREYITNKDVPAIIFPSSKTPKTAR